MQAQGTAFNTQRVGRVHAVFGQLARAGLGRQAPYDGSRRGAAHGSRHGCATGAAHLRAMRWRDDFAGHAVGGAGAFARKLAPELSGAGHRQQPRARRLRHTRRTSGGALAANRNAARHALGQHLLRRIAAGHGGPS